MKVILDNPDGGMRSFFALEELEGEIISYLPTTYGNKVINILNCCFFVTHCSYLIFYHGHTLLGCLYFYIKNKMQTNCSYEMIKV